MIKIIKSNFIFTPTKDNFKVLENYYLILDNGVIKEIHKSLPKKFENHEIKNYDDKLIIPSFNDIHVHAPQYINTGLGLDMELLPWLNQYTFPTESRFFDKEFATKLYKKFFNKLWSVGTMRSVIFGTIHKESTEILLDLFEESGLKGYASKVNMDRNSIDTLQEKTNKSLEETEVLIKKYNNNDRNAKYIITPRFVPSCTSELMRGLGDLAEKYDIPVQSHLSENQSEVAWVKKLHPNIKSFTYVYGHYGLLRNSKTIMAHGIYLEDFELELLKEKNITIAHCAQSNNNLSSGIMPLRKYLDYGIDIGIASDVGAGHVLNMNNHIIETIQASKLYWVNHNNYKPISTSEAFYLTTKNSGKFFGKVGSFEVGYEFDALVINIDEDNYLDTFENKVSKFIYTGDDRNIFKRFVKGSEIEKPFS